MEALDALILARIQFAANISFHILFPTITIALGWILFYFKLRFHFSKDERWMDLFFFWTKIFALCFALGVVSGVTMSFQFGTNWPGYMETVGNIAGPLLAYEILTAFFLEASFLGIMLFGFRRVKPWLHTSASFLVAFGTTVSAFWIIVLNSWMHTPAGFEMIDGQAHATSWFDIVFNPSMPYRFTHMLIASGLTAAFFVAGVSAFRKLSDDTRPDVNFGLKTGIFLAALLIPIQIFVGDLHGLNTLEHQPQKVAAMEANWETQAHVPLVMFALPNEETRSNDYAIEIPNLTSIVLKHSADGVVPGLNDYIDNHPPVKPVFFGFRIMVGMGLLMLLVAWLSASYLIRKKELPKPLLKVLVGMTFAGWVATLAGWYVTEIGRQPWLVYGVLRVEDAVADHGVSTVGFTLIAYLTVYVLLLIAFISTLFYMAKPSKKTPPIRENAYDVH